MSRKDQSKFSFWVIIIASGLIISGVLADILLDFPFWSSIKNCLFWIWNSILLNKVPLWMMIAAFLLGILVTILSIQIQKYANYKDQDKKKKIFDYEHFLMSNKQTEIDGLLVKWNYKGDYANGFSIDSVAPYCTRCDCRIVRHNCPNCGRDYRTHISKVFKDTKSLKDKLYGHVKQKLARVHKKFKAPKL